MILSLGRPMFLLCGKKCQRLEPICRHSCTVHSDILRSDCVMPAQSQPSWRDLLGNQLHNLAGTGEERKERKRKEEFVTNRLLYLPQGTSRLMTAHGRKLGKPVEVAHNNDMSHSATDYSTVRAGRQRLELVGHLRRQDATCNGSVSLEVKQYST